MSKTLELINREGTKDGLLVHTTFNAAVEARF
jgi:hypothetical protein